ncbi:hypothetical protein P7C73_g3646, partial [Tremellales sp. Uapishka_1]
MAHVVHANGMVSPPQTVHTSSISSTPPRVVLAGKTGRILCVADIRGDYHQLNVLIKEHEATAVIHTGDFGFIDESSLERMGEKTLRHLLQYSPLIVPSLRQELLAIPPSEGRPALLAALKQSHRHFALSQFPHLLSGAITFSVPVFTVWGLIEDVRVLEKFRTKEYEVANLSVIDEASTRLIDVGGLKLRLFGLGGAVAPHKMFDNGDGFATIAGGSGTMWTTALQIGELVDTAQRVYDSTETRLLVTTAPVSRHGILSQLGHAIKADLTISGGLHFRYPASFNEFAIDGDFEIYRQKLTASRDSFVGVYEVVKDRVDASMNEQQQILLKKALAIMQRIPAADDSARTNAWHWVLSDASCGHLLLSITDSRVSAETKSAGLNFSHRSNHGPAPASAPTNINASLASASRKSNVPEVVANKPALAAQNRPSPATAAIPPKVVPGVPATNNFKGVPSKPPGQPLARPQPPSAASSSAAPVETSSSVPPTSLAKSAQPARPPRGPASLAGQALAAAGVKGSEVKAVAKPASPKPTSAGNAKPATPVANGKISVAEEKTAAANDKKASGGQLNGTATPIGDKVNGTAHVRENSSSKTEEGNENAEPAEPPKPRHSLYLKGIPIPTTEDEMKTFFGDCASKITSVKFVYDHITKNQKNFAYVDFANAEDMQEGLKSHAETIRETAVAVSVSNPPVRHAYSESFGRGRGRGGMRGGRGGRGFAPGGPGRPVDAAAKKEGGGGEKKESGGGGGGGGEK